MVKHYAMSSFFIVATTLVGCAPDFQAPVGSFQSGVNTTVAAVRPYFVALNRNEFEYNLYNKIEMQKPWGTDDLTNAIPPAAIAVRLKALQVVSDYANALGKIANSSAPADLKTAATSLGTNVQSLQTDIAKTADKKSIPDLSKPITSIVNLIGQNVIEQMTNDALTAAIKNAAPDIGTIIDNLQADLQAILDLRQEELAEVRAVQLKVYNAARDKATPAQEIAMIGAILDENDQLNTLETLDAASLFADMKGAHTALVDFATISKSQRTPADISKLTDAINVFVSHAQLVADAVNAFKPSK